MNETSKLDGGGHFENNIYNVFFFTCPLLKKFGMLVTVGLGIAEMEIGLGGWVMRNFERPRDT
jgi:hypothetical protein